MGMVCIKEESAVPLWNILKSVYQQSVYQHSTMSERELPWESLHKTVSLFQCCSQVAQHVSVLPWFLDLNIMTCQDATNVGYILGLRFCQQTQILRLNFFYRHATTKTDRFNMTTCLRRCGCMHCKDLQTWMGIILIKCVIPTCYTYYTNKTSTCMHRNSQKVNISQGRSLSR